MVNSFKYLGRVISATDEDRTAVVRNLERVKKVWSRMLHILIREGSTPRVSGLLFKAVIKTVLIFGENT